MNWIGGEYRRVAPCKHKSLSQQQKAHFARARAAALCTSLITAREQQKTSSQILSSSCPKRICTERNIEKHVGEPSRMSEVSCYSDGQEPRLFAKRQELLQRADWLGLHAARPLRITFANEVEKGLIGRRRKLATIIPSSKRIHQLNRNVQPPPERHIDPSALERSVYGSIHFRMGADALTNPSQAISHLAPNRTATRTREPSSMDLLSEEPMLLDTDDEVFERHAKESVAWSEESNNDTSLRRPQLGCNILGTTTPCEHSKHANSSSPLLSFREDVPKTKHESPLSCTTKVNVSSWEDITTRQSWRNVLRIPTTSQLCASNVAIESFAGTSSEGTCESRAASEARHQVSLYGARGGSTVPKASMPTSIQAFPSESSVEQQDHVVAQHLLPTATRAAVSTIRHCTKETTPSDAIWRQFIIGDDNGSQSE